jgi:hypothetical protein
MSRDYFSILGLTPGRHDPIDVTRRFLSERSRLVAALDEPGRHDAARRQLEALHRAYRVLRDPRRQAELADEHAGHEPDRLDRLRRLIAASIEDGLLRYSNRQAILDEGRRLGISDFHAQLLIAEVQFGGEHVLSPAAVPEADPEASRRWARLGAAGALGLAVLLLLLRWLNG